MASAATPAALLKDVAVQVLGDSFIYHQIRKMVGLAIFALRYIDDASRLAWVKSVIQDSGVRYVPLAPSLGLMLERVLFQKENKTHGGHTVLIDFEDVAPAMRNFKTSRIYPEIDRLEQAQGKLTADQVGGAAVKCVMVVARDCFCCRSCLTLRLHLLLCI